MMRTFIMVRHGQSETNVKKAFTGQIDAPLTDTGREQAWRMAAYVNRYKVDKIYVSPLQRAVETAEAIAVTQNCPVERQDALMEINAGFWQGLTFDEVSRRYPQTHGAWKSNFDTAAPDGGETCQQVYERVTEFFRDVIHHTQEETVCFVAHAIPIRMMEKYMLNIPAQEISWVPNASVTVYTYDGAFRAVVRGCCDFLGDLKSSLPKNI